MGTSIKKRNERVAHLQAAGEMVQCSNIRKQIQKEMTASKVETYRETQILCCGFCPDRFSFHSCIKSPRTS